MQTVYEAVGGDVGLLRLARAWHARVMADEVVSHAFSHGFHPEHSERLAAYWAEALGGPTTYSDTCGDETSVVRIHSGNGPHEEMDRRAIACFDQAMSDVAISETDRVRAVLHDYFALGDHNDHVRVSLGRGGRAGWAAHSSLVLGRTTPLRHPGWRRR
jgi:hemoglobin